MLDEIIELFGNHYRLAQHLGVSPSTVYRWRDGKAEIPLAIQIVLHGYIDHPERIGQDIAKKIKDRQNDDR